MKRIKTLVALLVAAAMLFSLTACTKGEDVTGKYLCVGESYGDTNYGEPYEESWVELNKGGKGTYHSGFDFKMKWKLDGETFTSTVTFLGMEEAMDGTLKNGVLEVKYGDMYIKFVKEGVEPPADGNDPAGEPGGEPTGDPANNTAQGSGEKTGINEGVSTAATLLDAFAGAGASFGTGASTGSENGENAGTSGAAGSSLTVMKPNKIDNPSTWYGYVHCTNCWGLDETEIMRDAWGYVDTASKPYFEVFQETNTEAPFLSMYMTLEDNGTTIVPDIGHEDAWLIDVYLGQEEQDTFAVMLMDDGSLSGGLEYTSPDGSYGFFVTMRFRLEGSLWDESADRYLPPGYADYKAELMANAPAGTSIGASTGTSTGAVAEPAPFPSTEEYGKTVPEADGIVDFNTLKAAFAWVNEQTSYEHGYGKNMTYEGLWAQMGGVHGMKDHAENWRPDYHVYRWHTPEGDFLLMTLKVDENGRETWKGTSWSNSLDD